MVTLAVNVKNTECAKYYLYLSMHQDYGMVSLKNEYNRCYTAIKSIGTIQINQVRLTGMISPSSYTA